MFIRWKLTRTQPRYKNADVLVLSITKSGRTWLRVLINKYLSLKYGVPFELGDISNHNEEMPSIVYTHEMYSHYVQSKPMEYISGKFIIPNRILFNKKVVLLYRDPRDVVVSLFFQFTKRSIHNRKKYESGIDAFIRHRKFGIHYIIKIMNKWRSRLGPHPAVLWLSYEEMKKDTLAALIKVLEFSGVRDIDRDLAKEVVEFSEFENMKRMESSGKFNKSMLKPKDPRDRDSFKVREGKVGGYIRHFSKEEVKYLDEAVSTLSDHYGYR